MLLVSVVAAATSCFRFFLLAQPFLCLCEIPHLVAVRHAAAPWTATENANLALCCIFPFSTVGRNGSGKSNFFFGKDRV
jgi:hypothetical protein